jgi:hypothetical protein
MVNAAAERVWMRGEARDGSHLNREVMFALFKPRRARPGVGQLLLDVL